MLSIEATVV